jgi:uncharacterized membrane protein YdfJ with MMPL/SSD domain
MLYRSIAQLVTRRPKTIVIGAVVLFAVAGALGGPVAGLLSTSTTNFEDPSSESVQARHTLEKATNVTPGVGLVALIKTPQGATSPAGRSQVAAVQARIQREPQVAQVLGIAQTHDRAFMARDGRSTYLAVTFHRGESAADDASKRIENAYAHDPNVKIGGALPAGREIGNQVQKDLAMAELIAFPILFLLSLWIFRGVVAALLPLLVGGLTIVTTFLALRIVNAATPLSIFALNLVTGLGLGLAIDYSLFILSRYREELARGVGTQRAIARTLATTGKTITFSAFTVAGALASLLVFPQGFLYSMGTGGVIVALLSLGVSLLVLPAVLMLLGPRINAGSLPFLRRAAEHSALPAQSGFWYRLSHAVMRRPGTVAVSSAAVLILLGLPFLNIRFTGVDASDLPTSQAARQVDDALKADFPPSRGDPTYIAAHTSSATAAAAFAARLRTLPGAAAVSRPLPAGPGLYEINVTSTASGLASSSKTLVRDIRSTSAPFSYEVGGDTAGFLDQQTSLQGHIPAALAVLVVITLVVLFLMTGSVILPIKAIIMNTLSLSAAFGLLVLIFQDGRLQGLLSYSSQGALESTQPILLFAIAFGLSTDYGVLLLGRIKEAHDAGTPNREAVALGVERTGRLITAAALLFCVAIGAFATSQIVFIKEIGVGTALAVLIDASTVRALLVPSLMDLLGDANWWAPRPLARLHARLGLSEG